MKSTKNIFFLSTSNRIRASKATDVRRRGFTLVELIVSLGLFTVVLFIANSAFIKVIDLNRKARATQVAIENVSLAVEDMSRRLRTGDTYYCDDNGSQFTNASLTYATLTAKNCNFPSFDVASILFRSPDGNLVGYQRDGGRILRRINGNYGYITSPEVSITRLAFLVTGTDLPPLSDSSPRVQILIQGVAGIKQGLQSNFDLYTMVAQRASE